MENDLTRQLAFGTLRRHSDELIINEILTEQREMRKQIATLNLKVNIVFGALAVLTVIANGAVAIVISQVVK